jgi:hypothetical protein
MKRDLRRQTFSKPGKPDDEEIKKLTSDDTDNQPPPPSPIREKIVSESGGETSSTRKNGLSAEVKSGKATAAPTKGEKTNPFLLLRGQTSEIGIEKTGYRLRSDYMDLLKLVKRIKKGYTLEAVLDDALTYYFENSEDGRKAVKQRQMLDSE